MSLFLLVLPVVFTIFPQLWLVPLISFSALIGGVGSVVHTTNIADYGVISGNYDNDSPARFIFSFFPEEISEDFFNVTYEYTAQKGDTYACQIWLEFDIEDEEQFRNFIDTNTDSEQVDVFRYDTNYLEYSISNDFILTSPENDKPGNINIERAEIGKILYCEDTQHIIFYAMCMFDGGFSTTKIFGDFFTRFNIDPIEYEATANSLYTPIKGNYTLQILHDYDRVLT